jgi:hypothetical protein
MIFAKKLNWAVRWWIAFMNEGIHALLSCRHPRCGSTGKGEGCEGVIGSADVLDGQGGLPAPSAISRPCYSALAGKFLASVYIGS